MSAIHPVKYGFKVSVEIIRDLTEDTARVKVISPIYAVKEWFMPHSYKSSQFSDHAILNDRDFSTILSKHYSSK